MQVLQVESQIPQVPFFGTRGEGQLVLQMFRYKRRFRLQLVQVVIVPEHVRQFGSQKSQLLVTELAIAVPIGQLVKHCC